MKINAQVIIISIFVLFGAIGFILFSRSGGGGSSQNNAAVVVWGTLDESIMRTFAEQVSTKNTSVTYVQKNQATFERDLLEALASGTGPDLFFVSQDNALKYQKFIYQIPYQSYARRTFENTFIDEARLFLTDTGIVAFPLIVDPLVLYYNRSILSSSFVTTPPQYWDELITLAPRLTQKSTSNAIMQSGIAMGTFDNVANAKELLTALMLQTGNPVVAKDSAGRWQTVMSQIVGGAVTSPADSALRFYTSFSDSTKENYTWNASLPNSRQMFANGELGLYVGFASDLPIIRSMNTNLNFDVTLLPQTRNSTLKATYGKIQALAVSKGSKNPAAAMVVANAMTNAANTTSISQQFGLPGARRDVLSVLPNQQTYLAVFANSAIISRGFADPDTAGSAGVFKRMIDNVNARIAEPYAAVQRAVADMNSLLAQYNNQ